MNYYKTVLSLFLGYVSVAEVSAELAKAPFKARLNHEVFASVFHKRDQEILRVFSDLSLTPGHGEEVAENRLSGLSASIKAKDGLKHEDLDFELHLEKDFFGA